MEVVPFRWRIVTEHLEVLHITVAEDRNTL